MELKVTKIGNSLDVVLPKELIAQLKFEKGDIFGPRKQARGIALPPLILNFVSK